MHLTCVVNSAFTWTLRGLIVLRCPPSENLPLLMVSDAGLLRSCCQRFLGFAENPLDLGPGWLHLLARTVCRKIYVILILGWLRRIFFEKGCTWYKSWTHEKKLTYESERKLCICVKLPRGNGGGGSSSSTESTWWWLWWLLWWLSYDDDFDEYFDEYDEVEDHLRL